MYIHKCTYEYMIGSTQPYAYTYIRMRGRVKSYIRIYTLKHKYEHMVGSIRNITTSIHTYIYIHIYIHIHINTWQGLLETEHPYAYASRACFEELLAAPGGPEKAVPLVARIVPSLRAGVCLCVRVRVCLCVCVHVCVSLWT